MSQIFHIQKNIQNLIKRAQIIQAVRNFFVSQEFLEIDAPALIKNPGQEPYLDVMEVAVKDERSNNNDFFLHTSPEYTMKKVLGSGIKKTFCLGHVYRNSESFGGLHNPEFTMVEWYRADYDFVTLMNDCEELINHLCTTITGVNKFTKIKRVHMRDLFKQKLNIDLDKYLTRDGMEILCNKYGYNVDENDQFEDLFFKVFLNEIESELGSEPIIVHHYPRQMAALAKVSDVDDLYAERFELYINGIEIANAFSELCNPKEQKNRFLQEQQLRKNLKKEVHAIDTELLEALNNINSAAGIALGVDRLVMVLLGCKDINDVLVLPISKQ